MGINNGTIIMFSIWDFPSAFLRPRLSTYYDVKNVYSRGVLGTIFLGVDPILGNHEVQSPSPRSRSRSPELSLHRSEFWAEFSWFLFVIGFHPNFFYNWCECFWLRTLSNGRQSSGLNFFTISPTINWSFTQLRHGPGLATCSCLDRYSVGLWKLWSNPWILKNHWRHVGIRRPSSPANQQLVKHCAQQSKSGWPSWSFNGWWWGSTIWFLLKEFHARYIISTYIYSYISCIDFHPCPDLDLSIRHACDSVCVTRYPVIFFKLRSLRQVRTFNTFCPRKHFFPLCCATLGTQWC